MYHVQASKETLNEGILLIKGGSAAGTAAKAPVKETSSRVADCYEREALLEFWLKVCNMNMSPSSLRMIFCNATPALTIRLSEVAMAW
jgi:hypothetical protein